MMGSSMRSPAASVLSVLVACGAAPPTPVATRPTPRPQVAQLTAPPSDCEAPADGQSIYGMITENVTGGPLPDATVEVESSQTSTVTDKNGCYHLTMLPWLISWPGTFKVRINVPNTGTRIVTTRTRTFGNMRFDYKVPRSAFGGIRINECCP